MTVKTPGASAWIEQEPRRLPAADSGGGGVFGNFCVAAQDLPANPSHRQAPLLAHGTEGGRAEREEEGGYEKAEGEDIGEYGV